jgi:hypothetical protein
MDAPMFLHAAPEPPHVDASGEGGRQRRSEAEIEAIAFVAEGLRALEGAPEELVDQQIVTLARALGALELGDFAAARAIAAEALVPQAAAARERALALVRSLAIGQLEAKFLRLAGGRDPIRR